MDLNIDGITATTDPCVSPDGSRVAVSVSTINVEDDRYDRRIWMCDGSQARPFTEGPGDFTPRFSPDGRTLAFFRIEDTRPQLALIPVDGGEARVITDFACGVSGVPVWSPDSKSLAVAASVWTEEWADASEEERQRRPRRITTRDYRGDNLGWTHDKVRHVYLVGAETGEARRLSNRGPQESGAEFSPDGARVAFLSETAERPGYRPGASIWEVDLASGEATEVGPFGMWARLSYRPDGVLHALGSPGDGFPEPAMLWRIDDGRAQMVNDGHDRSVLSFAAGPPNLVWEGDVAVVTLVDSGAVGSARINPDGSVVDVEMDPVMVTGLDLSGGTFARTISTISDPGRLVLKRGDSIVEHTDFGGSPVETVDPDHFVVEGPGGDLDVWVYLPPGDAQVPLLLNIHGGPAGQYGWGFFDEFQVYASAGYGVVATNPRGSAGKDRDFLRAVQGEAWGRVDVEDIDLAVEAALRRHSRLDADRLGVMGGSYGGFLTAWLIAHQERWKTAIVERALLSWPSFGGTSDIGGWFGGRYIGDPDLQWDRSPLRLAERINTPTLILHSENDFRCPIEQAEQLFNVLAARDVKTEFVRFPGEGHELSRSGKPRHRQERFAIILEWLADTL